LVPAPPRLHCKLNSSLNPCPIRKRKKDFGIDQTPGIAKQLAFSGRSQRSDVSPVVGLFDVSIFLIRSLKLTDLIRFASLISLFLSWAQCAPCMRQFGRVTCKALQELGQRDVYAPRIRHSYASGGVVSHPFRCVAPCFSFFCFLPGKFKRR